MLASRCAGTMVAMSEPGKQIIRDFIQTVWVSGTLAALSSFWTEDCINHAMPGPENRGLAALVRYHEAFLTDFAAFTDIAIDVLQQVAEDDRVVTHLLTHATHTGAFFGSPPTGKHVALATIRIDRLRDGKIAEHWSIADVAGLMQQVQG